jgi:hypothetical protein
MILLKISLLAINVAQVQQRLDKNSTVVLKCFKGLKKEFMDFNVVVI